MNMKNIPQTSSGADAAVLVRWTTNTVRTQQPTGRTLSPPSGPIKNCTQLRPDCIQTLISDVHLPQNNVGIHFYSLQQRSWDKCASYKCILSHVHFTSIICYIQIEILGLD